MNYITYENTYSGKVKHIITEAIICYNGKHMNTIALWDTGASRTHITEDIVDAFEIQALGEVNTRSHYGDTTSQKIYDFYYFTYYCQNNRCCGSIYSKLKI